MTRGVYNNYMSHMCSFGEGELKELKEKYGISEVHQLNQGYNIHCPSDGVSIPGMPNIDIFNKDKL